MTKKGLKRGEVKRTKKENWGAEENEEKKQNEEMWKNVCLGTKREISWIEREMRRSVNKMRRNERQMRRRERRARDRWVSYKRANATCHQAPPPPWTGTGGGGGGGVRQLSGQPLPRRRHGSRNCEGGRGGCASHYLHFWSDNQKRRRKNLKFCYKK